MPDTPPTDDGAGREASREPSGGRWVRSALLSPPSRGQYLVAVLLAVLGFGLATQMRLNDTDDNLSGQRREELVQLLDLYSSARERAISEIDELQATQRELLSSSTRRMTALEEQRGRLANMRILSGSQPAYGPGIILTVEDPSVSLSPASMLNIIMELRDAGAEAIEINDTTRVVGTSYVTEGEGGGIAVDGVTLNPPYVIDVIGDSQTLSVAVRFRGGIADEVQASQGSVRVQTGDDLRVESLHEVKTPEYAQADE